LPCDLRGAAQDQAAGRDLLAFGDESPSPYDAFIANLRPIEDNGPHANEASISDLAAMHDGSMAHRHVIPDDAGQIRGHMEDGPILDIGASPYLDGSQVTAKGDIMPYRSIAAQENLARDRGARRYEGGLIRFWIVACHALFILCSGVAAEGNDRPLSSTSSTMSAIKKSGRKSAAFEAQKRIILPL